MTTFSPNRVGQVLTLKSIARFRDIFILNRPSCGIRFSEISSRDMTLSRLAILCAKEIGGLVISYKIPYTNVETPNIGTCDTRGNLIFSFDDESFSQPCLEYRSSECRPSCLNKKTICQCESNLFDFIFRREKDLLFSP